MLVKGATEDTFIAAQWEFSVNEPPLTDPRDYGALYIYTRYDNWEMGWNYRKRLTGKVLKWLGCKMHIAISCHKINHLTMLPSMNAPVVRHLKYPGGNEKLSQLEQKTHLDNKIK